MLTNVVIIFIDYTNFDFWYFSGANASLGIIDC
jgi:hypothetical protein